MDYNQEQFFRAQFDVPKMPFYMSYPMQNLYLTEMEYEKDMDRMKELYPKEVGRIVECVEDECDRMEYEGSLMFDEYPDRLMIEMVVDRIQKKVTGEDGELEAEQFHGGMQPPPGHRPPPPPPPPPNSDTSTISLAGGCDKLNSPTKLTKSKIKICVTIEPIKPILLR